MPDFVKRTFVNKAGTQQADLLDTGVTYSGAKLFIAVRRLSGMLQSPAEMDRYVMQFRTHMEHLATSNEKQIKEKNKTIAELTKENARLQALVPKPVLPPIHCLKDDCFHENDALAFLKDVADKGNGVTVDWIIYHYEDEGFDGSGDFIARFSSGFMFHANMGHCSCYGPLDDIGFQGYTMHTVKQDLNCMGLPDPGQVAILNKWREIEPGDWKEG